MRLYFLIITMFGLVAINLVAYGQTTFEMVVPITETDNAVEVGLDLEIESDNTLLLAVGGLFNGTDYGWLKKMSFDGQQAFLKTTDGGFLAAGTNIKIRPDDSYLFGYEQSGPAFVNCHVMGLTTNGAETFDGTIWPIDTPYFGDMHRFGDLNVLSNGDYVTAVHGTSSGQNFGYVDYFQDDHQHVWRYLIENDPIWSPIGTIESTHGLLVVKNGLLNGDYATEFDVLDINGGQINTITHEVGSALSSEQSSAEQAIIRNDSLFILGIKLWNDTSRMVMIRTDLNSLTLNSSFDFIENNRVLAPIDLLENEAGNFIVCYKEYFGSWSDWAYGFMILDNSLEPIADFYIDNVFGSAYENRIIKDIEYHDGLLHFLGEVDPPGTPWRKVYYARLDLNAYLGIKNVNTNEMHVQVYPNPTSDQILISGYPRNSDVELYSVDGRLLVKKKSMADNIIISLMDFRSGIYFLRINADNYRNEVKVIKE